MRRRHQHAKAVRTDQAQACGSRRGFGCVGDGTRAMTQARCDDDSGPYALAAGLCDSLRHGGGGHRDDHKIGCLSDRFHGFHGRKAFDLSMVGVDHVDGASKSPGKDIRDDMSADGTFVSACTYDSECARRQKPVETVRRHLCSWWRIELALRKINRAASSSFNAGHPPETSVA